MMARSHLTTGVTAGAVFAAAASTAGTPDLVAILAVPVVAYSAVVPDIDHPSSFITYSLGPVTITISWLLRGAPLGWFSTIGYGPWKRDVGFGVHLLPWRCPHRGPTHRAEFAPWVFGLLVAALAWWFLPPVLSDHWYVFGGAASLGVLTHIWGDARTRSGVPFGGSNHYTIGRTFLTGSTRADADYAWDRGELTATEWAWYARHNEEVMLRTIYRPAMVAALCLAGWAVVQP